MGTNRLTIRDYGERLGMHAHSFGPRRPEKR